MRHPLSSILFPLLSVLRRSHSWKVSTSVGKDDRAGLVIKPAVANMLPKSRQEGVKAKRRQCVSGVDQKSLARNRPRMGRRAKVIRDNEMLCGLASMPFGLSSGDARGDGVRFGFSGQGQFLSE